MLNALLTSVNWSTAVNQNFIFDCVLPAQEPRPTMSDDLSRTKSGNGADKGGPTLSKLGSNSTAQLYPKGDGEGRPAAMPPASVMTRLILIMVWRKLIRNPNTYSSLIGVIWSLVSYRSANRCQFIIFSISHLCISVVSYVLCGLSSII